MCLKNTYLVEGKKLPVLKQKGWLPAAALREIVSELKVRS